MPGLEECQVGVCHANSSLFTDHYLPDNCMLPMFAESSDSFISSVKPYTMHVVGQQQCISQAFI